MPVVIWRTFCVLVVDTDGMLFIDIRFLDNPAVPGTLGLDFVEIFRLTDSFEIRRGEK